MQPDPPPPSESELARQLERERRVRACLDFCRLFSTDDMERIAKDEDALRALVGIVENAAT